MFVFENMQNEKVKKAMYRGNLPIGSLELDCYVLDNEIRILSSSAIFKAFDRPQRGSRKIDSFEVNGEVITLPPFLASKTLFHLIKSDLLELITPVEFLDGEVIKKGYKAEILPKICSLYLEARRENLLQTGQKKLAIQAEILLLAIANVGIIALIDEATGFQYDRKKDALRILLEKYIADGMQKWITKRFPDKFFEELDRLYENEKTTSRARPQYYGLFINSYVYKPIEDGWVKSKLNELNITDEGKRKARFHQWLSQFGIDQLEKQIWRVLGTMEACNNLDECKLKLARQNGLTIIEENLFGSEEKIIKKPKPQYNPQSKPMIDTITQDNQPINEDNNFQDNLKKFVPKS